MNSSFINMFALTSMSITNEKQNSSTYFTIYRWLHDNIAIVITCFHGLQVLVQNADLLHIVPASGSVNNVGGYNQFNQKGRLFLSIV